MSNTPTSSETSSSRPQTQQAVFNYAAAAKRSSQIQDQQQRGNSASPTPSNTSLPSSSDKDSSYGSAPEAAATPSADPRATPTWKQSPVVSKKRSAYKTSGSGSIPRNARNASVQLPQAPPTETAHIQFGSINQAVDTPVQTLNITHSTPADSIPILKSKEVTFGSLPATDTSSTHNWQGQPQIRIQQSTTTTSSQPPPQHQQQQQQQTNPSPAPATAITSPSSSPSARQPSPPSGPSNANKSANNSRKLFTQPFAPQHSSPDSHHYHSNRPYRPHYNPKHHHHPPHSPSMQGAPYMPHHQKKPISPLMGTSPSMPAQSIPISHAWSSPGPPVPGQLPQAYLIPQGYDSQPRFYPQYPISPYVPPQSPAYVTPARASKAVRIIDPATKAEVKADARSPSSSSSTREAAKSAGTTPEERKKEEAASKSPLPKPAVAAATTPALKRIPIVDPAIANREKREREEAAQRAKEEAERKEREEKERAEAEQRAKEEAERKEREEKERIAAEQQRAKEEAERKEREEKERIAAEQQRAKEEADRKAREEEEEQRRKRQLAEAAEEKARQEAEKAAAKAVPGRLNVAGIAGAPATPQSPATRMIDDPSTVSYPPNIKPFGSKDPKSGKIQYDPAFLMQFAPLCLETSEDLSKFRDMPRADEQGGARPAGMGRRQGSERGRGPRTPGAGGDVAMFRHGSRDGGMRMEMGSFAGGRPLAHRAGSGGHGLPHPGSAGGMQREGSHGGRNRSGRGGGGGGGKGRHKDQDKQEKQQPGGPTIPPEQVTPLEKSENRWVPLALRRQREAEAAESGLMSDELITRKVKALLNKLTLEKFDTISDQIWEYAKQSEKEEDGHSLRLVIDLTFEKACDEPNFAMMWAQLCRMMYDTITDDIKGHDKEGNVVSGLNLFRKFLLNRCQHDFERGWKTKLPQIDENSPDMMSEEYYAAVKAKRQGLGLVQFIGELFKRHMLTERIMMDCLNRLAEDPKNAEDEETETMCKMVTTVGQSLDTPKTRRWLDAYFARMKEMTESPNMSSRIKFMVMDVFDLRKNKWATRRGNQPAPATIAEIREQVQKAKHEEKEAMKRTGSSRGGLPHSMSRAGSHRGAGNRDLQREGSSSGNASSPVVDGWNTVGTGPGTASPGRTNELANFGKADRSKARNNVLGPSNSPFASLHRASPKSSEQKSSPSENNSTNMFSALRGEEHERSEEDHL